MTGLAPLLLLAGAAAMGTEAGPPVEVLIAGTARDAGDAALLVDLRLLNGGGAPASLPLPDRIEARLDGAGAAETRWLERTPDEPTDITIAPGGFARARYRLAGHAQALPAGALLSIPAWHSARIAVGNAAPTVRTRRQDAPASPSDAVRSPAAPPPADRSAGNAFLANLSAYQPIYAVYGPGTNSEARIQMSFKYQLFGSRDAERQAPSWRDGLYFAYTQRMFWDLGADSSPFRNIDYQPELFYLTPSVTLGSGVSIAAQGGMRHESNGRDGAASRSINSLYIAPMAALPLWGDYRLTVAPRLSLLVGDRSDNPDIGRYRGSTALFMEVGEDNGLRLSASTRFNFASGKGAIEGDISYPLPRILRGAPDFYVFAQGFAGYGENLLDYDRRVTRLRIGLALVR